MKAFFTATILLITISLQAQIKKTVLIDKEVGQVHFKYEKLIDLDKKDTVYMVWIGFQDRSYQTFIDIKSIAIYDIDTMEAFIKDLKAAADQLGTKETFFYYRDSYRLSVEKNNPWLTIEDKDGRGYNYLTKKQVSKLIGILDTFTFGNDTVKN